MHEAGEVMKSGYFLNNGMASVLAVQPDGKTVEVGLIGKEGFVGSAVVFDFKTSPLRVIIQGDATAYRVDVPTLRRILPNCPGARATDSALCNDLGYAINPIRPPATGCTMSRND